MMADDLNGANNANQAAPPDPPKPPTAVGASLDGNDDDPYARLRGDPAGGTPNFANIQQQANEIRQKYHNGRAYDDQVYTEYADLNYGMRIIEERLDALNDADLSDDERNLCGDIRTFILRLRQACRNARLYGDKREWSVERLQVVRSLDEATKALLQVRFSDICAQYQEQRYTPPPTQIPTTTEEMTHWYYDQLHYRDRYFVLATAALESAPLSVVTQAALEIEKRFDRPEDTQPNAAPSQTIDALLARTFTMRRTIDGTVRVFWQKPELIVRAREFVAEQTLGMGPEREFLPILRQWSTGQLSERAILAIQMIAFIHWQYDQDGLRDLAREWATSKRWFSAAALMTGAYEAEYDAAVLAAIKRDDQHAIANPLPQSKVMGWLQQWARPQSSVALRRVAFFAYGMLGTRWPTVALDALESALNAGPGGRGMAIDIDTWLDGMTSYAFIAWDGHLRAVLDRLARIAQRFVERPRGVAALRNPTARPQHDLPLAVVFTAFFMIAASSLTSTSASAKYDLHKPLPEHPDVPLSDGRDVVLAGLLSAVEPEMRRDIVTLLAAAIIERQLDPVFELIRRWADATWADPADAEVRAAFVTRITQVAAQIQQWDATLGAPRPAFPILSQKLSPWAQSANHQHQASKAFAQAAVPALTKE